MSRHFFAAALLGAFLGAPALAEEPMLDECSQAGAGALFCQGSHFAQLNYSQVEGISFWLHREGFLSKVLVEEIADSKVDQAGIESRIMSLVSAQADEIGHEFDFEDLASHSLGGAPFGTLSYSLVQKGSPKAILHSYVATKGVVLQVISQIALKTADTDPLALQTAHAEALRAVHLSERAPEGENDA